ncbi:MAG: hypothetical protein ACRDYY_10910 [Acidimicrobiales bacterium]
MGRPRNAERALIAERRARVLAMRVEQRPYREIAIELGITEDVAEKDYQRAVEARRTALDAHRETAVAIETAKLDVIEQAVWEVLRRQHIVVQHGKVVYLRRKPMIDDDPVLRAADRLIRIAERRSRLRGYDAPTKLEVSAEVDAEIEAIAAALAGGMGIVAAPGEAEAPGDAEAG